MNSWAKSLIIDDIDLDIEAENNTSEDIKKKNRTGKWDLSQTRALLYGKEINEENKDDN